MKKYILFLLYDVRTDTSYSQVVGKTWKKLKPNDYIDIKIDLPDNAKEWVLCKVIKIDKNVASVEIVKEIK